MEVDQPWNMSDHRLIKICIRRKEKDKREKVSKHRWIIRKALWEKFSREVTQELSRRPDGIKVEEMEMKIREYIKESSEIIPQNKKPNENQNHQ